MATTDHNYKIKNTPYKIVAEEIVHNIGKVWRRDGATINMKQGTAPRVGATEMWKKEIPGGWSGSCPKELEAGGPQGT